MMASVYEKMAKQRDEMSKSQQKITRFILENRLRASFLNVQQMAATTGVSEASVIRFANYLGYKGYPQLQKDLQEEATNEFSITERLAVSAQAYDEKEAGILAFFEEEKLRIQRTMENFDPHKFLKVVDEILAARQVFIVCGRSATSVGTFFQYYLNIILGNVTLIDCYNGKEEALCDIDKSDIVIGITVKRYTRQTCELVAYAHEKGATTVAITDSFMSPLIKDSTYYFLAETGMPTYIDSFIAPLAIINAFLTYIGKAKGSELEKRFASLESLWEKFDVFYKKDM